VCGGVSAGRHRGSSVFQCYVMGLFAFLVAGSFLIYRDIGMRCWSHICIIFVVESFVQRDISCM